jgi:phosphoribosylanthranilate isomerase
MLKSQKGSAVSKLSSKERNALRAGQFAFPAQRKEPLENASHVRNAIARFDQVQGVSDAERDAAWRRIEIAARLYGVQLHEAGWRELPAQAR